MSTEPSKDFPDFPKYSLKSLRKTAATRILKLDKAEIASMALAHQTISEDELLTRYANLDWEKLYETQLQLEEELREVFEAAGPNPFQSRPKTYIGIDKTKQIKNLAKSGVEVSLICKKLSVSKSTVYRHLSRQKKSFDDQVEEL